LTNVTAFAVGERLLDRFRIDAVHTGGMGVLCAVTDAHTGRRYAVKTVKPEHRRDKAMLERFLKEARTWIDLDWHENLVQALWLVDAAEAPYLFLEFVDGPDLATVLEKGPIPLARALDLGMQMARGMAYAHAKRFREGVGIVHRDLKPSNLLVTREDLLKISDFGLARVYRGRGEETGPEEGIGAGTPAYMAPEQLEAVQKVDGRSDIYSFGLVLYELISGRNPLRAEGMQEQIHRIFHVTPPPLEEAPAPLAGLLSRCVAKSPADRPHDFPEVLAHLAQVARGLDHPWHVDPASVPPPSAPAGIALSAPALRPRRPRAGEPFAIELEVQGDLGPGPVELLWTLPPTPGLDLLTPVSAARLVVEAGGTVHLSQRLHLLAPQEGRYEVPPSRVEASGPAGSTAHRVPGFDVEVAFAFRLPVAGRETELAAIETLLRSAAQGEGGALFLFGETGSGKSRLLLEAARLGAESGFRTVLSRSQGVGMRPVRMLHDVARELLELPHGDTRQRPVANRIADAVNRLLGGDPATSRYFTELLLGGGGIEDEAPPAHAWFALLEAAGRRGPVLLLLDDVHLADESAISMLIEAARRAREKRIGVALLATATEGDGDLGARRGLAALKKAIASAVREGAPFLAATLKPLAREELRSLLDAVFPGHGFHEEAPWLLESIWNQTRGNVMHAAEILRALRLGSDALVRRTGGEWRLDPALSPARFRDLIPGVLEAGVRRRIDALGPETREVLDLAALAGEEFDVALLRAAVSDPATVDRAMGELEENDIVVPSDAELDRYTFRSAVVPPVVERTLRSRSPRRSRRLHLAIAEGMLRVYTGERLVRRALAIAHHLEAAGERARSLAFTLDGCERLLSLQLPEQARRILLQAAPIAESKEVPGDRRTRYHFLLGLACEAAGDHANGLEALTRYVESAAETGAVADPRSLARGYTRLGRIHQARGEYDRAEYCFGVARQLLEEVGDRRSLAFCYTSLAALALERGEALRARVHLITAVALSSETGNEGAAIQATILQGNLALRLDDAAGARRCFEDAEARARALGDRRRHAAALDGLGRVALRTGYLSQAQRLTRESLSLAAAVGDRVALARTLRNLGAVHEARSRVDRALREYRRAQRVFREVGHAEGVAAARLDVGRILRARGRTTAAIRELAGAAEELQALLAPDRHEAWRVLGEALADSGSLRAARMALARAGRGEPAGPRRRATRVVSRAVRADLYLALGDLARAKVWSDRALHHAARVSGHGARIAANLAAAEVELASGELHGARRAADTALAFANEEEAPFAAAAAERVLLELAARAGRVKEADERAHRAARAYTGKSGAGEGPARLLLALHRGYARTDPRRAGGYLRAARRCYGRLEAQGFRTTKLPDR